MILLLITISLMLNIFAFIAIIILYLRQNKLIKMDERQKNIIKEMEELMSTYLLEMKEENRHFINSVQTVKEEQKIDLALLSEGIEKEMEEREVAHLQDVETQNIRQPSLRKTVSIHAIKAYQKQRNLEHENNYSQEDINSREQHSIQENREILDESLAEKVKNMEKQGNSIEEIAKKLNKGKTEIALLLKLHGNIQE